jgi:hypothetical protein
MPPRQARMQSAVACRNIIVRHGCCDPSFEPQALAGRGEAPQAAHWPFDRFQLLSRLSCRNRLCVVQRLAHLINELPSRAKGSPLPSRVCAAR